MLTHSFHAQNRRLCACDCGDNRDSTSNYGTPDRDLMLARFFAAGCVDYQIDLLIFDEVRCVGPAFADLIERFDRQPG